MNKVIVILSGGMDSATLLYWYFQRQDEIRAISFDYGQRHRKELDAAKSLCDDLQIEHRIVDLSSIKPLLAGSSQTDNVEVPEGHYAAENMKLTVVPNRNMIMLAIGGAWAVSTRSDILAYGAHAGDHTIYPDCRKEFIDPMGLAFVNCDWHKVKLESPFIEKSKGDIAKIGIHLGVPFRKTWTCYKGREKHCGKCGACQERKEAFAYAGVVDPVDYEGDHVPA